MCQTVLLLNPYTSWTRALSTFTFLYCPMAFLGKIYFMTLLNYNITTTVSPVRTVNINTTKAMKMTTVHAVSNISVLISVHLNVTSHTNVCFQRWLSLDLSDIQEWQLLNDISLRSYYVQCFLKTHNNTTWRHWRINSTHLSQLPKQSPIVEQAECPRIFS